MTRLQLHHDGWLAVAVRGDARLQRRLFTAQRGCAGNSSVMGSFSAKENRILIFKYPTSSIAQARPKHPHLVLSTAHSLQ